VKGQNRKINLRTIWEEAFEDWGRGSGTSSAGKIRSTDAAGSKLKNLANGRRLENNLVRRKERAVIGRSQRQNEVGGLAGNYKNDAGRLSSRSGAEGGERLKGSRTQGSKKRGVSGRRQDDRRRNYKREPR